MTKTQKEIQINTIRVLLKNRGKNKAWFLFWLEENGYPLKLNDCTEQQLTDIHVSLKAIFKGGWC